MRSAQSVTSSSKHSSSSTHFSRTDLVDALASFGVVTDEVVKLVLEELPIRAWVAESEGGPPSRAKAYAPSDAKDNDRDERDSADEH